MKVNIRPVLKTSLRAAALGGLSLFVWAPFHSAMAQTAAATDATGASASTATNGTESTESNGALTEVVVTAQRREENLQNVPIAVTAIGTQELQQAAVQNTMDLKEVVPSLNIARAVGLWVQPFIRGIGTTSEGIGVENPVATYVDGVYMFNSSASLLQLHDIQQVAVLKGPQGTLFGRNATGGLIQYTTTAPSQTPDLEADATYGNLGTYEGNMFATGGLTSTLAGSLAAFYEDQSRGFGHDIVTNQWVFTEDDRAFRAKLLWEPDQATQVTFSADYSRSTSAQPVNRFVGRDVLDEVEPGGNYNIDVNIQPEADVSAGGYSLTVRRDLGFATFNSISAYRRDADYSQFDADGTPYDLEELHGPSWDFEGTQELQLLSPTTGRLTWVVGAFAMRTKTWGQGDNQGFFFGVYPTNISNGWGGAAGDSYTSSVAAYAQSTFKITDDTDLTTGLRWSWDHLTEWGVRYNGTWAGPVGAPTAYTYNNGGQPLNFNDPTYRISLDHHFSPAVMGYVSYNFGYKSGSFGQAAIAATSTSPAYPATPANPEKLDAFEVGVKSDLLDNHLRINSSVYYYRDYNRVSFQIINGSSELLDSRLATLYGLDTDLTWQLNDQFQVNAGIALEHAYYNQFGTSACSGTTYEFGCGTVNYYNNPPGGIASTSACLTNPAIRTENCLLPQSNVIITYGNDSDKRVEYTPDATVNLSPAYTFKTGMGEVRASVNYYYNSGWYAAPDNFVKQGSYSTLGAQVLWIPSDKYLVRLWGQNLTNTYYFDQLTETPLGPNAQIAPGRTYGVTFAWHPF